MLGAGYARVTTQDLSAQAQLHDSGRARQSTPEAAAYRPVRGRGDGLPIVQRAAAQEAAQAELHAAENVVEGKLEPPIGKDSYAIFYL